MSHHRIRDYHNRRARRPPGGTTPRCPPLRRVTAYRVAVTAAGLALLGTVGVLPSASASSVRPVVPKPTVKVVGPLDHHLCYTAAARGFKIPRRVVLRNQFNPKGFPVKIGPAVLHCNPVVKILPNGRIFPIKFPAAHLACFKIAAPTQSTPLVLVQNQFGVADLNVGQPALLCLPSWKRIGGPPHTRTPQPPNLGHFTCYPVSVQQGSYHAPRGIKLKDQFTRRPVSVKVSNVPVLLCVPTLKSVGGRLRSPYVNRLHLLCYPVSRTPKVPVVFDKNQFGIAKVRIGHTALLCLPSTKQILHP